MPAPSSMDASVGEIDPRVIAGVTALGERHSGLVYTAELANVSGQEVVVRVTITTHTGASVASLGSGMTAEAAETQAALRALSLMGVNAPVAVSTSTPEVEPEPAARTQSAAAPVEMPKIAEPQTQLPPEPEDEPALEDYSWTAFWQWARKLGYQNKTDLEKVLGQSITNLNPVHVRTLLRSKTGAE